MTGRADNEKEAAVADERKDRREVMAVSEHERNAEPESIVDSGSSVTPQCLIEKDTVRGETGAQDQVDASPAICPAQIYRMLAPYCSAGRRRRIASNTQATSRSHSHLA